MLERARRLTAADKGRLPEFVRWCGSLPEGALREEVARKLVDVIGKKEARKKAEGSDEWKAVVSSAKL
jgi:hypothetical protein